MYKQCAIWLMWIKTIFKTYIVFPGLSRLQNKLFKDLLNTQNANSQTQEKRV